MQGQEFIVEGKKCGADTSEYDGIQSGGRKQVGEADLEQGERSQRLSGLLQDFEKWQMEVRDPDRERDDCDVHKQESEIGTDVLL